jgi:hypothetical protein
MKPGLGVVTVAFALALGAGVAVASGIVDVGEAVAEEGDGVAAGVGEASGVAELHDQTVAMTRPRAASFAAKIAGRTCERAAMATIPPGMPLRRADRAGQASEDLRHTPWDESGPSASPEYGSEARAPTGRATDVPPVDESPAG